MSALLPNEAEDKPLAADDSGEPAPHGPGPVRLLRPRSAGLLLHSFGLSFVVQGMNSLLYGVLLGYLNVPGQVYFTTNEMLETDPDVCLAYMRAVKKAVQVIEADETGAASIEAMMPFAFPELDTPEAATLTLQAEKELWVARGDEGIGKIYPEAFAKGWEQMAAANLSDPDMDPSVAYTTAISDQL